MECDPLRDDLRVYAAALRAAGVEVRRLRCVFFFHPSVFLDCFKEALTSGALVGIYDLRTGSDYPLIGAAVKVRKAPVHGIRVSLQKEA